CQQYNNWFSF
nr:immunoglobulin light chain junction region [Macaca mulatta]